MPATCCQHVDNILTGQLSVNNLLTAENHEFSRCKQLLTIYLQMRFNEIYFILLQDICVANMITIKYFNYFH